MCAGRASPTCVDRSSLWRSRISDAPLALARAASHPGHTSLGRVLTPYSLVKQPLFFVPAAQFLRPGFCNLAPIIPGRAVAERRETFGCSDTRSACPLASKTRVNALVTPHARRLARRLASHDAGRSPLGAPPWRFWAPGAALPAPSAPAVLQRRAGALRIRAASSSHPGRSAWRAGSRASRGERLRAAAAGRQIGRAHV